MGLGGFIKVLIKNCDVLAGPLITLVYPLYASVEAIETRSASDCHQWLTYWVLYSLIILFEHTFGVFVEWIPIWPYAKFIVTCWLVLPFSGGAVSVYEEYVKPMFLKAQTMNIWDVLRNDIFSGMDNVLTSAEKFIRQNGSGAFGNLMGRPRRSILEEANAQSVSQSRRSNNYSTYDEVSSQRVSEPRRRKTILEEVNSQRYSEPRRRRTILEEVNSQPRGNNNYSIPDQDTSDSYFNPGDAYYRIFGEY